MMKLAPIGVSTYSRINHLKQTIKSLQENTLAAESVLYIFSDAPKAGDQEKVQTVRDFLKTIEGFKRVEIVERETNSRTYNNRQGMRMLLDQYGKMIFLEEDVVTAPSFLEFMNQALEAYKHNHRIFSISGYCPPIKIPKDYQPDVYALRRFCAWGFGIWKDRYDLIKMTLSADEVNALLNSRKESSGFGVGGLDMLNMLRKEQDGQLDALDVKIFFRQYQLQMDTVYPVRSLTRNIGMDGTGEHTKKTTHKDVNLDLDKKTWVLPPDIIQDKNIVRNNFLYRLGGRTWYKRPRIIIRLIPFVMYRLINRLPLFEFSDSLN